MLAEKRSFAAARNAGSREENIEEKVFDARKHILKLEAKNRNVKSVRTSAFHPPLCHSRESGNDRGGEGDVDNFLSSCSANEDGIIKKNPY